MEATDTGPKYTNVDVRFPGSLIVHLCALNWTKVKIKKLELHTHGICVAAQQVHSLVAQRLSPSYITELNREIPDRQDPFTESPLRHTAPRQCSARFSQDTSDLKHRRSVWCTYKLCRETGIKEFYLVRATLEVPATLFPPQRDLVKNGKLTSSPR